MTPLETSLEQAGLKPTGAGVQLSVYGPHWLHDSPLLEDFTLDEADIVGAGMFGARGLAVIRAGAAVGEMSMLDGEPRYATCTAIDAVEFAVLTRQAVAALIKDHPGVGAKLLVKITQLLAQRLRNTTQQLTRLLDGRTQQGAAGRGENRAL